MPLHWMPIPFDAWVAANPDLLDECGLIDGEPPDEECGHCYGEGQAECHECGNFGDCTNCDRTGRVAATEPQKKLRALYNAQVKRDLELSQPYRLAARASGEGRP